MSRHSLNRNNRPFFSASEREETGVGTQRRHVGPEGFKRFDACSLCLLRASAPVCCCEGHVFCRECALTNLLVQRQALEHEAALEKARDKQAEREKEAAAEDDKRKQIEKFVGGEKGADTNTIPVKNSLLTTETAKKDQTKESKEKEKSEQTDEKKKKKKIETKCPGHSHLLRSKDLINVQFAGGLKESKDGICVCPMCLSELRNGKGCGVVLCCGHVHCIECLGVLLNKKSGKEKKEILEKKQSNSNKKKKEQESDSVIDNDIGQCYVCSKQFNEQDIIILEDCGTGFASHDKEQAVAERGSVVVMI
ncbi:MAG: putative nitric oxide synthase-interacting protein [Streblomastix strix]|uniref:Putative nitric oxide synthase-interacting protein n=1 Tax=Streblomastix strix TaxID=222440 RepID=A0A5J4WMF5_9EUKA|nr:MAG: putative nitric oxide synthase-interacting protein [Streblomastix strix]